jgi:hypothetical protein
MEHRWMGAPYECALAAALPDGVELDALQTTTIASLLGG